MGFFIQYILSKRIFLLTVLCHLPSKKKIWNFWVFSEFIYVHYESSIECCVLWTIKKIKNYYFVWCETNQLSSFSLSFFYFRLVKMSKFNGRRVKFCVSFQHESCRAKLRWKNGEKTCMKTEKNEISQLSELLQRENCKWKWKMLKRKNLINSLLTWSYQNPWA